MRISDWSSDVCSSDLQDRRRGLHPRRGRAVHRNAARSHPRRRERRIMPILGYSPGLLGRANPRIRLIDAVPDTTNLKLLVDLGDGASYAAPGAQTLEIGRAHV